MTYTKDQILTMLDKSDKAVTRAVVAIYKRQTSDEQRTDSTRVSNNIGFNHADAPYLSYCAKYVLERGVQLSGKHLEKSRKRIKKYWAQLLDIANSNAVGI